jgi:hypothetical protein
MLKGRMSEEQEEQKVSAPKRRTRAEGHLLVAEFASSGTRGPSLSESGSELCRIGLGSWLEVAATKLIVATVGVATVTACLDEAVQFKTWFSAPFGLRQRRVLRSLEEGNLHVDSGRL